MTGKRILLPIITLFILTVFVLGLIGAFWTPAAFALDPGGLDESLSPSDPSSSSGDYQVLPGDTLTPSATDPYREDADTPRAFGGSSASGGGSSSDAGSPGGLDIGIKVWPAGPLVPCGGPDQPACDPCYIIVLVINLLNFMILTLAPAIALLAFLYAGFVYAFSGGSDSRITAAKTVLWNVVIGSLIVFGAYFIVDTVIKVVTSNASGQSFRVANLGPWNAPTFIQTYLKSETCSIFAGKPLERGPSGSLQQSTKQATSAIEKAANIAGGIIMGLSVLMIFYSAFLFTTNGGDSDRLTAARRALLFALAGAAIALLAFVVPNLVLKAFS